MTHREVARKTLIDVLTTKPTPTPGQLADALLDLIDDTIHDAILVAVEAERAKTLKTYQDARRWLKQGDTERALIVLDAEFAARRREEAGQP